jgi:hypothetical protein
MKLLRDFDDYMLDIIVEAVLTKESPLIFSNRFKGLINKIDHPIKNRLQNSESDSGHKYTYIDLDDTGLDKVSFITTSKAIEVITDYKKIDINKKDIEIPKRVFLDVKYNTDLENIMYSKFRSVTTIGKLINKLFPKEFPAGGKPGEDIQSFVDKFKSNRDINDLELVSGKDIVKWYNEKKYYDEYMGSLGNSCMKYDECEDYVQFYADNPHLVSLLILKAKNRKGKNKIKGRALVWKLSEPKDRIFMDRIYVNEPYDEELFKSYAKKEGWLYKYRQSSSNSGDIIDTKDNSKNYIKFVVKNVHGSSTNGYPYMDTLKYYSDDDGILSNDSDYFSNGYWTLESTDGGYEEEEGGIWVDYYGEYINEDDLIFCNIGNEYRTEDDAIYLDFYNDYATEEYIKRYMVECDYCDGYGWDAYRETEDTVDIYGTDEIACSNYAQDNLAYSDYHDGYLPEDKDIWSDYHDTFLYKKEAVEVYLNERQSKKDWRSEDDGTWWEWDYDNEKYDENVTEEELRDFNELDKDEKEKGD